MCTCASRSWLVHSHRILSPCTPGMHTYTHFISPSLVASLPSHLELWLLSNPLQAPPSGLPFYRPDPHVTPSLHSPASGGSGFFPACPQESCPPSLLGPIVWALDLSASFILADRPNQLDLGLGRPHFITSLTPSSVLEPQNWVKDASLRPEHKSEMTPRPPQPPASPLM